MKIEIAADMLSSLAQETRLRIFRLLVRQAPEGMAAGQIADALGVPNPTLSFHLAHLTRAGLLEFRRDGRSLFYAVQFDGIRSLLGFLMEECCEGRPELCGGTMIEKICATGSKTNQGNNAKTTA